MKEIEINPEPVPISEPTDKPPYKITCVIGDYRNADEYREVYNRFIKEGRVCVCKPLNAKTKLGYRLIERSTDVFVINKDGYIDEQTADEIEYAECLMKEIEYLEEPKLDEIQILNRIKNETFQQLELMYDYLKTIMNILHSMVGSILEMDNETLHEICTLSSKQLSERYFMFPEFRVTRFEAKPFMEFWYHDTLITFDFNTGVNEIMLHINATDFTKILGDYVKYDGDNPNTKMIINLTNKKLTFFKNYPTDDEPVNQFASTFFSELIKEFKLKEEIQ